MPPPPLLPSPPLVFCPHGELTLSNEDDKTGRVSAGTVARLVTMEPKEGAAPAKQLGGETKSRSAGYKSLAKSSKAARSAGAKSKRRSKQRAARPEAAKMAASGTKGGGSKSAPNILAQLSSKERSRGVADEVGRKRESINVGPKSLGRAHKAQRAQPDANAAIQPAPAAAEETASAKPRLAQEAKVAPRSSWQTVEQEAAQKKTSRSKAGVWLGAYERFKKRGQHDLASRALDRLGKLPGYASVAEEKRRGLRKKKKATAKAKKTSTKKAPAKKAPSKSQKTY